MTVVGATLQGRYRIDAQVKQGGMGTVFRATDLRLRRTVAVKESRLSDDKTRTEAEIGKLRRQFELEAQLLGALRHPALPIVIDHFGEGEELFLVMDYIEGADLGEVLSARASPFPLDEVLGWADQILDALVFIHGQTPPIIHRDIKPQNLKLSAKGQIVLLDFGLAKGSPYPELKVTASGSVFGYTPHYASPEQRQGAGTDARSDLYSLAATLYHLLSAKMPVEASARAAAAINNEPDPLPQLREVIPAIPAEVSELIHRTMSLKRESRPTSAAELRWLLRVAGQAAAGDDAATVIPAAPAAGAGRPGAVRSPAAPGLPAGSAHSLPAHLFRPGPQVQTPSSKSRGMPSKFDHAFFGGLVTGGVSAALVIATLALNLGIYGVTAWLLSLSVAGALVALSYAFRSPAPVRSPEALKIGVVTGMTSAVVQWLLLMLAHLLNVLPQALGNGEALVLLVSLLGLMGCVSPLGALVAARFGRGGKVAGPAAGGEP